MSVKEEGHTIVSVGGVVAVGAGHCGVSRDEARWGEMEHGLALSQGPQARWCGVG